MMSKAEAGRRGGQTTAARHGSSHMAEIGKRGAAAFWAKYSLKPAGVSGWVVVERETDTIVNSFQSARLMTIMQEADYRRHSQDVDSTPF